MSGMSREEEGLYGFLYNSIASPTFFRRCLAAGGCGV